MKKYKFTGETKTVQFLFENITPHRIKAITSFEDVVAGELGGWIEKEENLSQGGNAWVGGDAWVFSTNHILTIGAIGSRDDFTTFFRDKDNEITIKCGCFLGKIDKFFEKVAQTHGNSKYAQVYKKAVELAKLQILTD